MEWFEYRLFFDSNADIETILFLLHEYGLEGSFYDEPLDVFRTEDGYGYLVNEGQEKVVVTFSMKEVEASQWMVWFASFGLVKVDKSRAEQQTGEEWKEMFSPITITSNVEIVPEWMRGKRVHSAPICLFIEPGAAFGTGLHGTTQDCIRLMEKSNFKDRVVLDLGSGSGILSILANKMGAKKVIAIDVNPSAELELKKNMSFNEVNEGIESRIVDVAELELPRADIVICNIGLKENLEFLPRISNCLSSDGVLIVSGIIEWGLDEFLEALREHGLQVADQKKTEEWISLLVHFK